MKPFLVLPFLALSLWAQTAQFPGAIATDATMFRTANNVGTKLAAPQSATATSLTVASSAGIVAPMLISVGSVRPEIEAVCAVNGNVLTIGYNGACPSITGRGFDGTTAVAHAVSASAIPDVNVNVVSWLVAKQKAEIQAIETALGVNLENVGGTTVTWPGSAGVPNYSGANTWGTSYTVGTAANNLVQLNASGYLPALNASLLTNFPTLNQSTTGNAATATALASAPTKCTAGNYPLGIDIYGNADTCTALPGGTGSGTTSQYWRGDQSWQDLNPAIYAALSGSSPVTFNGSTGAIACPTCVATGGAYNDPSWLTLTWSGGRLTGIPTITNTFNGRSGTVVPTSGDYTFSQIGGSKQGTTSVPQMAGTNSGVAGAELCNDANGNATTSGCTAPGVPHSISIPIAGNPILTGTSSVGIPGTANFSCTINKAQITGNASGAITVDIWKAAGAVPSGGNKISASAPVTLSSAQLNQNSPLTGWTTAVSTGDVFWASVASVDGVLTKVGINLTCQ